MSNDPTIIDAVSSPVVPPSTQSIPIKINTSQIEQVIKDMAAKSLTATTVPGVQTAQRVSENPVERINPSTFIRDMSIDMAQLYQRFDTLKILALELNGRSLAEPMPATVIFRGLTLDFAINKNDVVAEHSVKLQTLSCIGDVSGLMTNEFGYIIASLKELSAQVAELAQQTNERTTAAFKDWEAANKDRQVIASGITIADGKPDDNVSASPPETITLQTQ